jgi:hypothetical protein
MPTLSLRRLWVPYKRTAIVHGTGAVSGIWHSRKSHSTAVPERC